MQTTRPELPTDGSAQVWTGGVSTRLTQSHA